MKMPTIQLPVDVFHILVRRYRQHHPLHGDFNYDQQVALTHAERKATRKLAEYKKTKEKEQ